MDSETKQQIWASCIPVVHLVEQGGLISGNLGKLTVWDVWAIDATASWKKLSQGCGLYGHPARLYRHKILDLIDTTRCLLVLSSESGYYDIPQANPQTMKSYFSRRQTKSYYPIKAYHDAVYQQFVRNLRSLRKCWPVILSELSQYQSNWRADKYNYAAQVAKFLRQCA